MQITPFAIERYYLRHEFTARHMLSSSDCESWPLGELLALEPDATQRLLDLRLGYTEAPGAPELREAVAECYETLTAEDVLVVAAAEEGIFTVLHGLLAPGDHAVIETPCYGSAIEVARSTGAEASPWQRRFEDGWAHDLDALRELLRPQTRLIYVNSPHNPTGTTMPRVVWDALVALCDERDIVLFSDEVYRELEHDPGERLPAACDALERGISLGSVAKSYGLPGLRLGWVAARDVAIRDAVLDMKLYTTICSSAPSELLTAIAVRHRERLIARNHALTVANLGLVDALLDRHRDLFAWVRPTGASIGFPRVLPSIDVRRWCEHVAERAGVLLLPGDVYGVPMHVRLGFGRITLLEAIEAFEHHLKQEGFLNE